MDQLHEELMEPENELNTQEEDMNNLGKLSYFINW